MSITNIEWTNYTWNPWVGCKKISAGCKNCYMYREQIQRGVDPAFIRRTKTLNDPLKWEKLAIIDGKKKMVFTCSYSDFFLDESDSWRDEAWDIIRRTPHLIYQILTKRIERVKDCLPPDWPLPNVWLGVTAENQAMADERIPLLLQTPAALRFVSVEPMLGEIDVREPLNGYPRCLGYHEEENEYEWIQTCRPLDWVICGCESGPGAKPMELDWARNLRDQCQNTAVPFFLKQMMIDGKLVKMPKLDGMAWSEIP